MEIVITFHAPPWYASDHVCFLEEDGTFALYENLHTPQRIDIDKWINFDALRPEALTKSHPQLARIPL